MMGSYYESETEWKDEVWQRLQELKGWIQDYQPNLGKTFSSEECKEEQKAHYWVEVTGRSNYEYLEPGIEEGFRHFFCTKPTESDDLTSVTTALGDDCPQCIDLDEDEQDECEWCEGGRYFQVELFGLLSAKNADEAWGMAFDLENR